MLKIILIAMALFAVNAQAAQFYCADSATLLLNDNHTGDPGKGANRLAPTGACYQRDVAVGRYLTVNVYSAELGLDPLWDSSGGINADLHLALYDVTDPGPARLVGPLGYHGPYGEGPNAMVLNATATGHITTPMSVTFNPPLTLGIAIDPSRRYQVGALFHFFFFEYGLGLQYAYHVQGNWSVK